MRMFGKPVVDGTTALETVVKRADREGAEPRNPENCVGARSVKRSLNGDVGRVKIGAAYAYVEYENRVERLKVSEETREMVRAYDAGGFYPTGVTIRLIPVPPTRRLGTPKPNGTRNRGAGKPNVRSEARPWLRHAMQETSS